MSAQNTFVTIQEAVGFTKKSEKTIRRLVKGLVMEDKVTGQVTSQDTDILRVENKNGKHFYSLSSSFLREQYGSSGHQEGVSSHTTSHEEKTTGHVSGHSENMTGQTGGQKEKTAQTQGLERYVSFLEDQVKVKDEQIKNFQERSMMV